MAFGALKGTLSGSSATIGTSLAISTGGPVTVAVGDLVYALIAEQAAITSTACADNLGNSYTAVNAGTDAGTIVTGRAFVARVTTGGSLSSVTFTANGGSSDVVGLAAVIEGPFLSSGFQDSNVANVSNDLSSPYQGPATGTLGQATEVVMCWFVENGSVTLTATSPNLLAVQLNISTTLTAAIGYQLVAATTSIQPAWTSTAVPTQSALGTTSFKAAAVQNLTPGLNTSDSDSLKVPAVSRDAQATFSEASAFFRYRIVLESGEIRHPVVQISSLGANPALISDADSFSSPTVGQTAYVPFAGTDPISSVLTLRSRVPEPVVTVYFTPTVVTVLTPGAFTDADTIYTPVVAAGAVAVTPGKYTESDSHFAPVVAVGAVNVAPSLFTDSDTHFTPIVAAAGVQPLIPTLFTDSDTHFAPVIIAPQTLAPSLIVRDDSHFAPVLGTGVTGIKYAGMYPVSTPLYRYRKVLDPFVTPYRDTKVPQIVAPVDLLVDNTFFFAPTITVGLIQSLFTDSDTFFAPIVSTLATITPLPFVDSDAFYGPVVINAGFIVAGRINDADNLFTPTVVGPPAVEKQAAYSGATGLVRFDRFIPPMSVTVVIRGSLEFNVNPGLLVDPDVFFGPSVVNLLSSVTVGRISDFDTLYVPSIGLGAFVPAGSHAQTGILTLRRQYIPAMSVTEYVTPTRPGLQPGLFVDSDTFFSPVVAAGAVNISPNLYVDMETFYSPSIVAGATSLTPVLISDTDQFFMQTIMGGGIQPLAPNLIIDADNFYVPLVAAGTVTVSPIKFTDNDTHFAPVVAAGIAPQKFTDADTLFSPSFTIGLLPNRFTDNDLLFTPVVFVPQSQAVAPGRLDDVDLFFESHPGLFLQFITPGLIVDEDRHLLLSGSTDIRYDYPIGHSLSSDYGIRKSKLGPHRLIIGRR